MRDDINALLNKHVGRVLRAAEIALPNERFRPFRRMVLDEFGRSGFGRGLERLLGNRQDKKNKGLGWPIPQGKEDDDD